MGLILRFSPIKVLLFLTCSLALFGAPKLRLSQTVIGPISVSTGKNGPVQTLEVWNAGDGTLHPQINGNALWTSTRIGSPAPCATRMGTCLPITITLQTLSLAKGTYTTVLTMTDPAAIDAPQTITVSVTIGGGVPDKVDLYVAPSGSARTSFHTNNPIQVPVATQSGGHWLAVTLDGAGSYSFVKTYNVKATAQPGMKDGDTYSGSFVMSGSSVAEENRTVPVTMHISAGALADVAPALLSFRVAEGAKIDAGFLTQAITVTSRGSTPLAVSSVTASEDWLKATATSGSVSVSVDPTGLSPGVRNGTVTINSNAVTGPFVIPVTFEVFAVSPPLAYTGGTLTNTSTKPDVAPGTIAWMFGEGFTLRQSQLASWLDGPLPTALDGVKVYLNDRAVPVYFVSYGQIDFQIPFDTRPGDGVIHVERDGVPGNSISITVNLREPRVIPVLGTDYGAIVNLDSSLTLPASYGCNCHPAKAGDYLVIYALGLGPTAPEVTAGVKVPDTPLSWVSVPVRVVLNGNTPVNTFYAGLTPGYVGLYQVNFQVPANTPLGDGVQLALQLGGDIISPPVSLAIQE